MSTSTSCFKVVINPAWEGTRGAALSPQGVNTSHAPLHSCTDKRPLTGFQRRAMENVQCQGKRAGAVLNASSHRGHCDSP